MNYSLIKLTCSCFFSHAQKHYALIELHEKQCMTRHARVDDHTLRVFLLIKQLNIFCYILGQSFVFCLALFLLYKYSSEKSYAKRKLKKQEVEKPLVETSSISSSFSWDHQVVSPVDQHRIIITTYFAPEINKTVYYFSNKNGFLIWKCRINHQSNKYIFWFMIVRFGYFAPKLSA